MFPPLDPEATGNYEYENGDSFDDIINNLVLHIYVLFYLVALVVGAEAINALIISVTVVAHRFLTCFADYILNTLAIGAAVAHSLAV